MLKRELDFILNEGEDTRLLFRFYPQNSHCHSFNERPPKTWDDVYKVYYVYAILQQYRNSAETDWEETEVLFESSCDEGSALGEVAAYCIELTKLDKGVTPNYLNKNILPMGDGILWKINKYDNANECAHSKTVAYEVWYVLDMWHKNGVAFKLSLPATNMQTFGTYLDYCCEYMLKHGQSC